MYEKWTPDTAYTEDYAVELEKQPGKDFVVLNFSDVQLSSAEVYGTYGEMAEATIKKAIKEVQPDLITLTGDNAWCKMGYIRIAKVIDSYGIPWAAVMGNHDGDNGDKVPENWCAYHLANAKNSVFKYGPEDMGVGNYIINITENGFFDLAKALGSTKNMIAGHDHINSSSIMYDGIRLSYSLKCGPGCYWDESMNGGSTLTIGSDGHAVFAHHYVDPSTLSYHTDLF